MANAIAFNLLAPYNKAVSLIGSFSDWNEIVMEKGKDGYFRTQVELEDGEYTYQFRVQSLSWHLKPDQWVTVNDPYATQIDLQTQRSVVRVKQGERIIDTYVWQHDHTPLPANEELVIYEMHVADFVGLQVPKGDRFKAVVDQLDYLRDLGINAIELMPVTEYAGDYRWGYLVRDFFAPESSYGPPEDLKRLVDECHARGIRVLLDGIYNHTDEKCPLLQIDRDYWYYHGPHYPDDPDNYWGPEFNYDHYDANLGIKPAWKFVGDVVRFWVQEYHIDGIRFDAVRQLNNYEFLAWIAEEAKQAAPNKPFYDIAEHIPDSPCITCCGGGPLEGCWHESFRVFAIEHICGDAFNLDKLKEGLDGKRQGYGGTTTVINYLASHDRERTLTELGDRGIFDESAFRRAKLGAVLLLTAMGVPMIWMGDEFGEYKPKAEQTTQPNALQWQLLQQSFNQDLWQHYRRLIALRQENAALRSDHIEFFHENPGDRVLAYVRWHEMGARIVVVANFSDQDFPVYEVPHFPAEGTWQDWFTGEAVESRDGKAAIELPHHTAKILVWR